MLQREVQKAEIENRRNQSIITEYKQICSQLSLRLEQEQAEAKQILQRLQSSISDCSSCSKSVDNLSGLLDSKLSNSVIPESEVSVNCHPLEPTNSEVEQRVRPFANTGCQFLFTHLWKSKHFTNVYGIFFFNLQFFSVFEWSSLKLCRILHIFKDNSRILTTF